MYTRSEGPNIDWGYLKKLHPAIRIVHATAQHVDHVFKADTRGKKHTVPRKDLDVVRLQESYQLSRVHIYEPGRKLPSERDRVVDLLTQGCLKLQTTNILQRDESSVDEDTEGE